VDRDRRVAGHLHAGRLRARGDGLLPGEARGTRRDRRRDARRPAEDALLLLALLFLLRCALDPWNIGYYHLPFLLSLVAWEALRFQRPPVLTLISTGAVWFIFEKAPAFVSPDAGFLLYMAFALPMAALLARWCFGPAAQERRPAAAPATAAAVAS
jgi:hypothetical protein